MSNPQPRNTVPVEGATLDLITTNDVCRMLNISRSTVNRYRKRHPDFPPPIKLSPSCVRYPLEGIKRFIATATKGTRHD